MRTQFIVIGMPDNQCYISKNKEILDIINSNTHFSGGKRHYELLRPFLPVDAVWIDIKSAFSRCFRRIRIPPEDRRVRFGRSFILRICINYLEAYAGSGGYDNAFIQFVADAFARIENVL